MNEKLLYDALLDRGQSILDTDLLESTLTSLQDGWFADYFFDNLFMNLSIHSQITRARADCQQAMTKVNQAMHKLQHVLGVTKGELYECEDEETAMILSFGQ